MSQSRLFRSAVAFGVVALVMSACGDGETNDPNGTGGAGGSAGDCAEVQTVCGGVCVETATSHEHCGACDSPCSGSELCVAGQCEPADCREGQTVCGNECVTVANDRLNCGACGTTCKSSEICAASKCVAADCPTGQDVCDGLCTTVANDRLNCGACGTTCGTAELCVAGVCELTCTAGLIACGNSCVNPLADPDYCGATSCTPGGAGGAGGAGPVSDGVECGALEACVIGECREFIRKWNPGEQIDVASLTVGEEQSIGVDSFGNALVAFRQQTGAGGDSTYRLFSTYYSAATKSWTAPILVDSTAERVTNIRVAMNPAGDAYVVWATNPNWNVLAAKWDGGTKSWGAPVSLESLSTEGYFPDVGIDDAGEAFVAWVQAPDVASNDGIYVRRTVNGVFQTADLFPSLGFGDAQAPQLVVNAAGSAAIIYQDQASTFDSNLGTDYAALVRVFSTATDSWGSGVDIRKNPGQTGTLPNVRGVDVGADDDGVITAVWSERSPTSYDVLTKAYTPGVGWGPIASLEGTPDAKWIIYPSIAVARDGHAIVSAIRGERGALSSPLEIHAFRRDTSGTWTTETILDTGIPYVNAGTNAAAFAKYIPLPGIDGNGNGHIVWTKDPQVFVSTFSVATATWTSPASLNTSGNIALSPRIAVAENGNAFASWVESAGGVPHLFAAKYD